MKLNLPQGRNKSDEGQFCPTKQAMTADASLKNYSTLQATWWELTTSKEEQRSLKREGSRVHRHLGNEKMQVQEEKVRKVFGTGERDWEASWWFGQEVSGLMFSSTRNGTRGGRGLGENGKYQKTQRQRGETWGDRSEGLELFLVHLIFEWFYLNLVYRGEDRRVFSNLNRADTVFQHHWYVFLTQNACQTSNSQRRMQEYNFEHIQ